MSHGILHSALAWAGSSLIPAIGDRLWRRPVSLGEYLVRMRNDWDRRAHENARYYVATANQHWTDEDFYASGEQSIAAFVLTDLENVCQGSAPEQMKVLEIGCGAGRETCALARVFGEVHAIDISPEMVRLTRKAAAKLPNVFVYQNNGMDLAAISEIRFDFAYSHLVFQHIQDRQVIYSYVREVHRLLRPGALFKFQVQGFVTRRSPRPGDTWVGAAFSEEQIIRMAAECGFESRYREGAGEQAFWNWFFRDGAELRPACASRAERTSSSAVGAE